MTELIIISLSITFFVYLIQDAVIFAKIRNDIKVFLAKKIVSGGGWLWKFPNHWFNCPFCLSFFINLIRVVITHDWISITIIPVLVSLIHKYTFRD